MSLRARSCVIAGLVTGIVALVLTAGLAIQGYRTNLAQETEQIAVVARRVALVADRSTLPDGIPALNGQTIQVVSPSGKVLYSTSDVAGEGPLTHARPAQGDFQWDGTVKHGGRELIAVGVSTPQHMVYVAAPKPGPLYDLQRLAAIAAAALLGVASAVLLTWIAISKALKPVEDIRAELGEITATAPHRRVPRSRRSDEIGALATTVNQTLDRLDDALSQQRRFVAEASHELRSPIAALRAEVDLALMEAPEDGRERTALEAVDRAGNRLQLLVEDLLAVARLDAGMVLKTEHVDLSNLVIDELSSRHPAKAVHSDLLTGVVVDGDPLQLSRVIVNLLDNALRHAETSVHVRVSTDRAAAQAVLEVRDDGAGVAPEDRERVFQRFTRLAEGRARDPGGSGLGLPIAREVVIRHGGTLVVEEGARFVLRLPLVTRAPLPEHRDGEQARQTA